MDQKFTPRKWGPRTPFVWVAVVTLALFLSSFAHLQNQPAADPQVWIEFPFEGINLPNQTITFAVYASSAQGIATIDLKINSEALPAGTTYAVSTDGNALMARRDQAWQPPAEGEYTLEAVAHTIGGASSSPTSVTFCVGTCGQPVIEIETGPIITLPPDEPTWTPSPSPEVSLTPTATHANTETPTPTPVPYSSPTPTPYTEPSAEFWAAPPYINAGECTTLNWNVSGDFQAVYFEGTPVNASGSDSECPSSSYTYHLQVVDMYGSASDYWADVEVSEPPPPADTTGPSINWTNLVWESCQFYGEAGISDESGVAWAQFYYNKNGEGWASVWMSELSADYWQSEVGISVDDGMGTIEYYVIAGDTLGNQSESSTATYDYMGCDG